MKTSTKIFGRDILHTIMMILMMGWMNSAWAGSDPIKAIWDFQNGSFESHTYQKVSANLAAYEMLPTDATPIQIFIDASSGKFDIQKDKQRVQFNKGTKVQVPVVSTKDVVEVKIQKPSANYPLDFINIGGLSATGETTTYRAKKEDVERGYVLIEGVGSSAEGAKSNTYLYYISVTQYPPVFEEKCLYNTNFQDWDNVTAQVPAVDVPKKTIDGQDLTFSFNNTQVAPTGTNTKFKNDCITQGYMCAEKERNGVEANFGYVETSELKDVTYIKYVQAATGGKDKRGWGVKAQVKGETGWTDIYTTPINNTAGEIDSIRIDKKNVKLRFYNILVSENAFMTSLEIYGNVEIKDDVNITYHNTDGTVLGTKSVSASDPFTPDAEIESQVNIGADEVFRGWFNGLGASAEWVKAGSELSVDLDLYAKVTKEEKAEDGTSYEYDMRKNNFYQEHHELIDIKGGVWHDNQHGWYFDNGGTITLHVASTAHVDMTLCKYSKDAPITVTDHTGAMVGSFSAYTATDAEVHGFDYKSNEPTELTVNVPKGAYIHGITLFNFVPIYLTFDCSDKNIQGIGPDGILCEHVPGGMGKATMPGHMHLYRTGWTFEGWTDGTNIYESGKEYSTFTHSVTLKPKMVQNTTDLTDTFSDMDMTWYFDQRFHQDAPVLTLQNNTLPYTKTILINNELDVTLLMDASQGKILNTESRIQDLNNGAEGAQINSGTKFKLPAVYDMKIRINASVKIDNANDNTEAFFGKDPAKDAIIQISDKDGYTLDNKTENENVTVSEDNKTIEFTYKGDAKEIEILIDKAGTNSSWGFYNSISVTYPSLPMIVTQYYINEGTDESPINAGRITITPKNPNIKHNNTGIRYKVGEVVTVKVTPKYGYDFNELQTQLGLNDPKKYYTDSIDYTVGSGENIITAIFNRKEMQKLIVKPSDISLGTVSLSPQYANFYKETKDENGNIIQVESWYVEGTEVTLTAEAKRNYMLEYWAKGEESLDTNNPYKFQTKAENQTITAHFVLGNKGSVIFEIPEGMVHMGNDEYNGTYSITPDAQRNVRSFAIPSNYTFYKDKSDTGFDASLQYWVEKNDANQENHYYPGLLYSFKTADQELTLVPVFQDNPADYTNRFSETIIRYDFAREPREYNDPTTAKSRKVCAQEVNIGKNQKPFWTTQAYIQVMENGENKSHNRDVDMWIDTGSDGYVRNIDLDDWCAFGPGTTLWVPSGNGTKISMLTYSKITTTTFDGKVPTLDEERTMAEREKMKSDNVYVYSCYTTSTTHHVPIRIGDDYSYYQWLELDVLEANMVNLHTHIDSDVRGAVAAPVSKSGKERMELEDGGYAFRQGDRVKLDINRKFGYKLDKITDPTNTDSWGNPATLIQMNEDGTVTMINTNDISQPLTVQRNEDGSWGGEGTPFVLREVEDLTDEEKMDSLRTRYELEFSINDHRTFNISFKEKATYYITFNAGQHATGTAPEAIWLEEGDDYIIPRNQTLYYEGNTLAYWTDDEGNRYKIGSTYQAKGVDLRLFPVFEPNQFSLLDLTEDATATWCLNQNDGAPVINFEGSAGILVTQLTSNGKSIDLKVALDGTKGGKFNNVDAKRPERIQINAKSIIEIPTTPSCEVTWRATQNIDQLQIGGTIVKPATDAKDKQVVTGTCNGESSTDTIVFISGIYSKNFSITYKPQTAQKAAIGSLTCNGVTLSATEIASQIATDGHVTFTVSPWEYDDKIPEVTGTATNGGTVSFSEATIFAPSCVATVRTASGFVVETCPIEFTFNTPDTAPKYVKLTVNGTEYTNPSNELFDVAPSGLIKVEFDRTMKSTYIKTEEYDVSSTAKPAKILEFRYWDIPKGGTVKLTFPHQYELFKDYYGKPSEDDLALTLHIIDEKDYYHHHKFDFVVGEDGDINEAIKAANGEATGMAYNNTKENNHRYFIFVPDGEYELTGNTTLDSYVTNAKDENGKERPDMAGQNNHMTKVLKPNVSLIGQSKEGTIIWNHPIVEGISYTATLHLEKNLSQDFYAEDLTLENRFDYWGSMSGQSSGGAGRAAALTDCGNRTIMKNVALKSWQDTYYSNNSNAGYRAYFEQSDLYGVVDWLCGNGNIWYEKCNIVIRDRSGNNIAAPSTEKTQQWGYVFNNCTIKPETEQPTQQKDKDWTLARPWNNSPACTFLNTTMFTQPRSYGWNKMTNNLPVRFHEYRSMDANNTLLSLGTRSLAACSPAPGSDDCILSDAEAELYTIRNAVGGDDAFEPNVLCRQIDAKSGSEADKDENHEDWNDQIELDDDELTWTLHQSALCYFVFKLDEDNGKWMYQANTIDNRLNLTSYGSGYYCVRAANPQGGLGAATKSIKFDMRDPYWLEIKQTGDLTVDNKPYGWSTICLPFNAKVPEEVTVYAATAHDKTTSTDKVTDLLMTLTPVEVIDSMCGYVVYGAAATYAFTPTSRSCDKPTILSGNPTKSTISSTNIPCYVLANKTWGLGFYKYTGATLAPYRAWLPENMVDDTDQESLATGRKAIRFTFADNTTRVAYPTPIGFDDGAIYNLSGIKENTPAPDRIYISGNKGKKFVHRRR